MSKLANLTRGIVKENPIFVLMLGMCPTLATTTSAINGMGMGLVTLFVLVMSNMVISMTKNLIPDKVRIPVFILIFATFGTIVQLCTRAYAPSIYKALGLFIPLVAVNCIILGRAEAFASKNNIVDSILDGLGMGIGFTVSLTVLGVVREILGSGSLFGMSLVEGDGILLFVLAPGAFIVLGFLLVIFNKLIAKSR